MKALSREQVGEEAGGETNLTLTYDWTTKGHLGHHAEVEVATKSGTFLTGLQQQPGNNASNYMDSINLCWKEVQDNLLTQVSNTMADCCVTNSAVDKLIEEDTGRFILSDAACNILMLSHIKPTQFWRKRTTENQLHIKGSMPHKKAGESHTQALLRAVDKCSKVQPTGKV